MKTLKVVHYGVIELGSNVKVSDPCYGTDVWCSHILRNVSPGHYDCYAVISDEGRYGNRVAYLVACKDGVGFSLPKTYVLGEIGVDAGCCGIYDLDYFEKYHTINNADDRWYNDNVVKWCETDKAHICESGLGFITDSGYGDGGYDLYVDEENGEVVRIAIDYLVNEGDSELEFEEK